MHSTQQHNHFPSNHNYNIINFIFHPMKNVVYFDISFHVRWSFNGTFREWLWKCRKNLLRKMQYSQLLADNRPSEWVLYIMAARKWKIKCMREWGWEYKNILGGSINWNSTSHAKKNSISSHQPSVISHQKCSVFQYSIDYTNCSLNWSNTFWAKVVYCVRKYDLSHVYVMRWRARGNRFFASNRLTLKDFSCHFHSPQNISCSCYSQTI